MIVVDERPDWRMECEFDRLLEEARIRESMVLAAILRDGVVVSGLSSGHIVLWHLEAAQSRPTRFSAGSTVYSVLVVDDRLVCGCDRYVVVYEWGAVKELEGGSVAAPDVVGKWATPSVELASGARLAPCEANALAWDGSKLWVGCGDGCAYAWDVAADAVAATVKAHDDMILALGWAASARQLATGSEDGTVALYDERTDNSRRLNDLHAGKKVKGFCSALLVDDDATWVTCAGGTEPVAGAKTGHAGWLATYHAASNSVARQVKLDSPCRSIAQHNSDVYVGSDHGVAVYGLHDPSSVLKPSRVLDRGADSPTSVYAIAIADPAPPALLMAHDDAPEPDDDLGSPPAIVRLASRFVHPRPPRCLLVLPLSSTSACPTSSSSSSACLALTKTLADGLVPESRLEVRSRGILRAAIGVAGGGLGVGLALGWRVKRPSVSLRRRRVLGARAGATTSNRLRRDGCGDRTTSRVS